MRLLQKLLMTIYLNWLCWGRETSRTYSALRTWFEDHCIRGGEVRYDSPGEMMPVLSGRYGVLSSFGHSCLWLRPHSAEGCRAARLSLFSSRYCLQEEKVQQKLEESPAMSVDMYGSTPGVAWL